MPMEAAPRASTGATDFAILLAFPALLEAGHGDKSATMGASQRDPYRGRLTQAWTARLSTAEGDGGRDVQSVRRPRGGRSTA
jgi:hypothetical protein